MKVINLTFKEREGCPLCGSRNHKIVYRKNIQDKEVWNFLTAYYKNRIHKKWFDDAVFSIACCKDCSFIFQKYILDDKGMNFLYENIADHERSLRKRESASVEYFKQQIKNALIVGEFFECPARDIDVLDFGMGWGHWAIAANACGYSVIGCEISERRIKFAQDHGVNVTQSIDNTHLYDFINADQVLEHISSPLSLINKLASKLKSGGVIRVSVPDGSGIKRDIQNKDFKVEKGPLQPLEHINCFTWHTLISLMKKAGLKPVGVSGFKSLRSKIRAIRQLGYRKKPNWYFTK